MILFGGDGEHCLTKRTTRDYEAKKIVPIVRKVIRPITINNTRT